MAARVDLIWTPHSKRDLKAIFRYIAAENPQAAKLFIADPVKYVSKIADLPDIGKPAKSVDVPGIRELIFRRYRIFYRRRERQVQVLALWHSARGGLPRL